MDDITKNFGTLYYPTSALVFYQSKEQNEDNYVEYFDMDKNGNPLNAHPLTEREAKALAISLAVNTKEEKRQQFLKPKGILPTSILHINPGENASVVWFTKAGKRNLFFSGNLEISNGIGEVPAMLWSATERNLTDVDIKKSASLEEFIQKWEDYFFNSYFSHLMYGHNPIRGNCVNLWKELIETGNKFPKKMLKKSNKTLKNLLK